MAGDSSGSFNPRIIGAVIIAAIIGFIAFWVLSAFAPNHSSGNDGAPHALSRSATSYSALLRLLEAGGAQAAVDRGGENPPNAVIILTPNPGTSAKDLEEAMVRHGGRRMLIILPKWRTVADPRHPGWVRAAGQLAASETQSMLPSAWQLAIVEQRYQATPNMEAWLLNEPIRISLPSGARGFGGSHPSALWVEGRTLIARVHDRSDLMVTVEPDLFNNQGIATPERAQQAVTIIQTLSRGAPIRFDVTMNGHGAAESILKLAFVPPFLGLTICLLFATLLALWAGFQRFGPAWREQRAVPLGKAALLSNGARLIAQAGRVPHFGAAYADMMRDVAARRLHAPPALTGADLDRWLDRFADGQGRRFSTLVGALMTARSTTETVARARDLALWRKDILRDHS